MVASGRDTTHFAGLSAGAMVACGFPNTALADPVFSQHLSGGFHIFSGGDLVSFFLNTGKYFEHPFGGWHFITFHVPFFVGDWHCFTCPVFITILPSDTAGEGGCDKEEGSGARGEGGEAD